MNKIILFLFGIFFSLNYSVYGQTYTSSSTGNWTIGSTWVGGSSPVLNSGQLNNNVVIDVGHTVTLSGNLTVKNGITLTVRGKLIVTSGGNVDFQNGSIILVESGGTLEMYGLNNSNNSTGVTIHGNVVVNGNYNAGSGSDIDGNGTLSVSGTTSGVGTTFGQVLVCTNCTAMTGGVVDVIVDGNAQNIDIPIDCGYRYNYSEQIYYRSEINRSGNITSLSFEYDGYEAFTEPVKIYLGLTSKTSFSGSTDWVTSNNMTLVYTGNYVLSNTAGWYTITFDTPFYYNNVDNLVIGVYEYGYNYHSTSADFYSYSTSPTNRVIYFDSDSQNPNPASPPTADGIWYYVPSLRLKIEDLPAPLPIELLYFKPKYEDDIVKLRWSTASEHNNDYFTIEKSYDGIMCEVIKNVPGAGNSTHVIDYYEEDRSLLTSSIVYYRLKQTDFDGKFVRTDWESVFIDKQVTNLEINPNPFDQELNITFISEINGIKTLNLTDLIGNVVYHEDIMVFDGVNHVKIKLNTLSCGVYLLNFNKMSFKVEHY